MKYRSGVGSLGVVMIEPGLRQPLLPVLEEKGTVSFGLTRGCLCTIGMAIDIGK